MPITKIHDRDAARNEMLDAYDRGWTLREIAADWGVTYGRVWQLLNEHPDYNPRKPGPVATGDGDEE